MPETSYQPAIPGVTEKWRESDGTPALTIALEGAEPVFAAARGGRDEDATEKATKIVHALEEIARSWYQAHQWLYDEDTVQTAHYYGAQYAYSGREGLVAYPAPRRNDHVRIVVNLIKPTVDQGTGILTQEEPIFKPHAATSEGADSAGQKAAAAISAWNWRHGWKSRLYRLNGRKAICGGTAIIHVGWDPSEGPMAPGAESGLVAGTDGMPIQRTMNVGDIRRTMLSSDQVAFEPSARGPMDGEGVFIREKYTIGAYRRRFPEAPKPVIIGGSGDWDEDMERALEASRASPNEYTNYTARTDAERDDGDGYVLVYTLYVRSCREYPNGLMVVFGGDRLLHVGPNPKYPQGKEASAFWTMNPWPLFVSVGDHREGSPWGRGRVVDLIGPQRSFNGVISKALQHVAKISNAKVFMPKGVDAEWTDEIGQIIRLNRTFQPGSMGYMQPPQLPSEYMPMASQLQAWMEYIIGVNSSTMGQASTDVNSGRQANMLMQRDYGRLQPMKKDIDRVWSEMESYEMLLTQRHMTGERQLIVVGKNNETSLFFFNQADLPTQVDYHVENDQSLPQDQAQRSTIVTQLMQTLAMTEDKGLRSMHIRLLGLTDFEHMAERLDPDQVKAERLVAKLLIGESEPVFEGDDPLIFKLELERLMKSEQYVKQVAAEIEEYGVSPLEQMSRVLWTHYTTAGSGQPMAPVPAEPGPVAPEPEAAPEEPIPGDVPVVSEDPVMEAA